MWALGQYSYQTTTTTNTGVSAVLILIYLAVIVAAIAAYWKVFVKAGQAGWKAIIPIYSTVITCRIVGLNGWYTLLLFVPIVNIIFAIYLAYKLAQSFGYGVGMTILELFLVGYFILGFGSAKYHGPSVKPSKTSS